MPSHKKMKQTELANMPEASHRDLLLSRVDLAEAIDDKKTTLKNVDEKILEAMKREKATEWSCETADGQKYRFTRRSGSEKIQSKKIKEKKLIKVTD